MDRKIVATLTIIIAAYLVYLLYGGFYEGPVVYCLGLGVFIGVSFLYGDNIDPLHKFNEFMEAFDHNDIPHLSNKIVIISFILVFIVLAVLFSVYG